VARVRLLPKAPMSPATPSPGSSALRRAEQDLDPDYHGPRSYGGVYEEGASATARLAAPTQPPNSSESASESVTRVPAKASRPTFKVVPPSKFDMYKSSAAARELASVASATTVQARLAAIDPLRAEEASDSASGLTARRRKLLGLMLAIVVAMAGVVIAMRAPAVPPLPPRRPWGKKRKE